MVQHFRALVGHAVRGAFDDQVIGLGRDDLFERELRQRRPAQLAGQIGQPHAHHEIVDQRARAGEIAAPLVIGGHAVRARPGQAGEFGVHAADQRLAALDMTDCGGDLADLRHDFGIALGRGELQRADIAGRRGPPACRCDVPATRSRDRGRE